MGIQVKNEKWIRKFVFGFQNHERKNSREQCESENQKSKIKNQKSKM